jgi:hypothetical protein
MDGTESKILQLIGSFPKPTDEQVKNALADLNGVIKPVAKTDDMTQPVGADELGGLWTAASGGSECSLKTKKIEVAVTEAVSEIVITFTREDAELWNKATRISVLSYCQSGTPWKIRLQKTDVDGTVTALAFTGSLSGWRTDITHLLPIGNIATKIETNSNPSQMTEFYARQLFDSNTATISFVLAVENGSPVPPNSYMKVYIEGVM